MATRGQPGDLRCRMWLSSLTWKSDLCHSHGVFCSAPLSLSLTLLAVQSPQSSFNCYFGSSAGSLLKDWRLFFHFQRYGSEGLKLVNHEETVSFGQAVLKLTFDPGSPDDGMLTAECRLDHPFFVKTKGKVNSSIWVITVMITCCLIRHPQFSGWSSFYPSLTVVHHGIPCYEMQLGDVCLPPNHPDAINCDDSVVFDTFRR